MTQTVRKGVARVTLAEFAEMRNVTRQAIHKWEKKGMPGVVRSGRAVRIDAEVASYWLDYGRFEN